MTYTAIPNGDVDPDSPITTGLVTLLRDNPIAMMAQDAGAPVPGTNFITLASQLGANIVDTSEIIAAAVGRSEIANSTTTSVFSGAGNDNYSFILNDWALFPMIHHTPSANSGHMNGHGTDGSSAASPRFSIKDTSGGSNSGDLDHRWIIAA